jgi:hypothetical protein
VLPDDASDIAIKTTKFGVDDYQPYITLNDKVVLNLRSEAAQQPRDFAAVVDLSKIIQPGKNKLHIESFNKTTLWAVHMTIKGTYKTAGACKFTYVFHDTVTPKK